jgi:hypothetical protein
MFYAAKCYWPGVTQQELERAILRTASQEGDTSHEQDEIVPLGCMLFPNDALVLCLFSAASSAAVIAGTIRAGLPCDRVMDLVWLTPQPALPAIRQIARKETR